MKKIILNLLTASVLLLLATSCSRRHTVILTPDPDGHVGRAEVLTNGGKQLLEKPFNMTTVSGMTSAPSPVEFASSTFIVANFADALAIVPLPPEKFILFFETGTTVLAPESRSTMATVLDAIKRRRAISISISGHTDSSGSVQLNEKLSYSRAQNIRDILIQQGVNPEHLNVSSHGNGNPLVPTVDGVAEPQNRRVEIIVR